MNEALQRGLPDSRLSFPVATGDRLKYIVWRLYTPFHTMVRDATLRLGITKHEGRQECLQGRIATGKSVGALVNHLVGLGFGNHFIAWKDDGEIVSMRLAETFSHQYHIRIFADGEVRGHYERTPECNPVLHLRAVGQEARTE